MEDALGPEFRLRRRPLGSLGIAGVASSTATPAPTSISNPRGVPHCRCSEASSIREISSLWRRRWSCRSSRFMLHTRLDSVEQLLQRSHFGLFQEEMGGGTALFGHLSHVGTRIPFFNDVVEAVDSFETLLPSHYVLPMDGLLPDGYDQTMGQNIDRPVDVMHGATDKRYHNDSYSFNVVSPSVADSDDVVKALAPSGVGGVFIVHYQNAGSVNPAFNSREPSQDFIYSVSPSLLVNHINIEKQCAIDPRALGGGFSLGPMLTEGTNLRNVKRATFHMTSAAFQMPLVDPLSLQCQDLMTIEPYAQTAASLIFPQRSSSYADLLGAQRACLGYYGLPALGQSLPYAERHLSPFVRPSPVGPGSPIRHGDHCMSVPSILRQLNGSIMISWHLDTCGVMDERCPSSLLEE